MSDFEHRPDCLTRQPLPPGKVGVICFCIEDNARDECPHDGERWRDETCAECGKTLTPVDPLAVARAALEAAAKVAESPDDCEDTEATADAIRALDPAAIVASVRR